MFGYVREYAPEMKVKEAALYKAVYCGLCKSMGKCTGNCSRLTLSYDVTFLAVIRMALEKTTYCIKDRRCVVHPIKKRPMMENNDVLDYCARASALLSFGKLCDDINDSKGIKRVAYRIVKPIFAFAKKRAGLSELYEQIESFLSELSECESAKTASVDIPAEIFGRLTAEVLSFGLEGQNAVIAKSIGFYTGKWIYTIDALDDLKDDIKSGSYNPFYLTFGKDSDKYNVDLIKSAFVQMLAEIEKAADLIDFADDSLRGIVYNLIYYGMKNKSDKITEKDFGTDEKGDKN